MRHTVEEVRAIAKRLHDDITVADGDALMASDMLTAYAERIKADEGANDRIDFKGMWNAMSDRAYAHPPAQATQVDAWQIVCDSIRTHQFVNGRDRRTVDVECLLNEINERRKAAAPQPGES